MRQREFAAARRLARALLESAASQPEAGAAIRAALMRARSILAEHREVRVFLSHPRVPFQAKERLLPVLVGEAPAAQPMVRVLAALTRSGSLDMLPALEEAYVALWNARRRVVAAEVISAAPLAPAEEAAVRAALAKATGMGVDLGASVDPSVVGGLMVNLEGRRLDGTVRGRLQALRERLRRAAVAR